VRRSERRGRRNSEGGGKSLLRLNRRRLDSAQLSRQWLGARKRQSAYPKENRTKRELDEEEGRRAKELHGHYTPHREQRDRQLRTEPASCQTCTREASIYPGRRNEERRSEMNSEVLFENKQEAMRSSLTERGRRDVCDWESVIGYGVHVVWFC
jgi:hypothetical protein